MRAFVYIVRCADGSYYTGSHRGDDPAARVAQHNAGTYPHAYTHARRPVELIWAQDFDRIDDAVAAERQIKGWSRAKKEAMIHRDWDELKRLAKGRTGHDGPTAFEKFRLKALSESHMTKSNPGNFYEDFSLGQVMRHATPRTITTGDVSLYTALTGSRYALFSADTFAQACGLPQAPVDPLLAFHVVFGKTVPDISLNAVANLGYAEGLFRAAVYPGDTLHATSEVIGLKENSNGKTGVVHVRTTGVNQRGEIALSYARWVMVSRRGADPLAPKKGVKLAIVVDKADLKVPHGLVFDRYDFDLAGAPHVYDDYEIGEKIDHVDGMTVQEAEHQIATRLYQNTAKVHFDHLQQKDSRFGKRLIYGGVAISIARALAFNGLANAAYVLAINAGRHVHPLFAWDTVYAWSEVLDKAELTPTIGALRLRLVATKNLPCTDHPGKDDSGEYNDAVILDLDYWAAIPR